MRYHVPFAHRNQRNWTPGPVYIGFDEPVSIQKRKRLFNWCGFTGLMMALVSPFTLFVIAPLALVLSLFGMRRAPRGMAFFGLIISMIATTALSLGIFGIAQSRHHQYQFEQSRIILLENRQEIQETMVLLQSAQDELRQFRSEHDHQLPGLDDGMMMTVRYDDAWDQPLRYGITSYGCIIRSTGPDQKFNTSDDLTVKLDGNPMSYDIGSDEMLDTE